MPVMSALGMKSPNCAARRSGTRCRRLLRSAFGPVSDRCDAPSGPPGAARPRGYTDPVSNRSFRPLAFNGEDIILWRALAHVADGRYVGAGTTNPATGSVTGALAEQGWKGVDIPPAAVLEHPLDDVLAEHGLLGE